MVEAGFRSGWSTEVARNGQIAMYGPPLRHKRNVRLSQVGLRKCIQPLWE
jgi:hypothetical protein